MWFINWFCNNPTEEDLTEQCSCNWEVYSLHLHWCKYWNQIEYPIETLKGNKKTCPTCGK